MSLQQTFERALMEGELDPFDFMLAERLGKSLAEIGALSNNEYLRWRAWHVYRQAMSEMK